MRLIFTLTVLALASVAAAQNVNRVNQARATAARAGQPAGARTQMGASALAPSSVGAELSAAGTVRGAGDVAGHASVRGLWQAISMFAMDTGRLPTSAEGLNALLQPPPGVKNWKGPYISVSQQRGLNDPWGMPYRFINTTPPGGRMSFTIKSNGPDRLPDTADDLSISG
jgi:hypothetical protein